MQSSLLQNINKKIREIIEILDFNGQYRELEESDATAAGLLHLNEIIFIIKNCQSGRKINLLQK